MKLSTKCRYGMRAMIELARRYDRGPVKRKDLSQVQDISKAYIENIFITLREKKTHRNNTGRKRRIRSAIAAFKNYRAADCQCP